MKITSYRSGMLLLLASCSFKGESNSMEPHSLQSINEVVTLLPQSTEDIDKQTATIIKTTQQEINRIIIVPDSKRTFDNTVRAFDRTITRFDQVMAIMQLLQMVSPHATMRETSIQASKRLHEFRIDNLSQNKKIYDAFISYKQQQSSQELLEDEEQYFLQQILKQFQKNGLDKPREIQEQLRTLAKELAHIEQEFEAKISNNTRTISVPRSELEGLTESFISSLSRTHDNKYILGVDYPTYHQVLENCSIESTRYSLWNTFVNRGYPENTNPLKALIAGRDKYARLLGYASYADLYIDDEMAGTIENVQAFLDNLAQRIQKKAAQEQDLLKKNLPDHISLTADKKFKPWDIPYIKAVYKKQNFNLDERIISEYFPLETTLASLLNIYEQFFSLRFIQLKQEGFWHPDVKALQVYGKNGISLGYLILDLFPRDNKYTHACQLDLIPATKTKNTYNAGVAVVIANFPPPTAHQPSLLFRKDVITFFHEFGHALHSILGATNIASFSGTRVKRDFVEMPSQMLEEWMWDASILKRISKHYVTGDPLPDNIITMILKTKNIESGSFVQRQIALSSLALEYFKAGEDKDIYAIEHSAFKHLQPEIATYDETHIAASFGHLTSYGPGYYCYLWSRVYALDLFYFIKPYGLLNPIIGEKYRNDIIGRGGSVKPEELLVRFLGRSPRSDAFFTDLGVGEDTVSTE
jgi:thimet oligopeptidase